MMAWLLMVVLMMAWMMVRVNAVVWMPNVVDCWIGRGVPGNRSSQYRAVAVGESGENGMRGSIGEVAQSVEDGGW